jgi:hypothetical protein
MKTFHRLKKEVGLKALKKAEYKCEDCNKESNLCVHHIQRMNPDNPNYNELSNLKVLCRSCHMSFHRKAGHIISEGKGNPNPNGRRGKDVPEVFCHCGKLQHGKGLCKKHYAKLFRRKQGW